MLHNLAQDYRSEKKSLQILVSRTQAGPGRKVKQEQEEISRNHVPRLFLGSVHKYYGSGEGCKNPKNSGRRKQSDIVSLILGGG